MSITAPSMRSAERVRALAQKGTLDPRAAAALLEAIESKPKAVATTRWVEPFARLSTRAGVAVALALTISSVVVSLTFDMRFDGFLDIHRVAQVSARVALLDQIAVLVIPTLVFFGVSALLTRGRGHARLLDFFLVVAVARAAVPLCAVPIALFGPSAPTTTMTAGIFAVLVFAIIALATHLTWLWQGFRSVSGLAGGRAVTAFVIGLAVAESLSKMLLSFSFMR